MSTKKIIALTAAAAISLGVVVAAVGVAGRPASKHAEVEAEPAAASFTAADLADSYEMADSYETEALASWQPEASRIAAVIRDRFPDDFVATSATLERFSVTFVGSAPDEALSLLSTIPVPVDIVEGVGVSEAATLQVADEVHAAIATILPTGIGFSISPDPAAKTIDIVIHRLPGASPDTPTPESVRETVEALIASIDSRGLSILVSATDSTGGEDSPAP